MLLRALHSRSHTELSTAASLGEREGTGASGHAPSRDEDEHKYHHKRDETPSVTPRTPSFGRMSGSGFGATGGGSGGAGGMSPSGAVAAMGEMVKPLVGLAGGEDGDGMGWGLTEPRQRLQPHPTRL